MFANDYHFEITFRDWTQTDQAHVCETHDVALNWARQLTEADTRILFVEVFDGYGEFAGMVSAADTDHRDWP